MGPACLLCPWRIHVRIYSLPRHIQLPKLACDCTPYLALYLFPAASAGPCQLQTKEEIAKRTQLLLQIATSGLKVEEEMEKHASELDFACVRLMEKRIEAAHRCEPSLSDMPAAVL